MEITEVIEDYIKTRDSLESRIQPIADQLNQWVEKYRLSTPSTTDIAHFEGLRAERAQLLTELTEAERQFVLRILQVLPPSPGVGT